MLVFVAVGVLGLLCVLATMVLGNMLVSAAAVVIFLLLVVVLAVLYSAMQGIYVTALYMYARTGSVPAAFSRELIENAFVPKQAGPGTI